MDVVTLPESDSTKLYEDGTLLVGEVLVESVDYCIQHIFNEEGGGEVSHWERNFRICGFNQTRIQGGGWMGDEETRRCDRKMRFTCIPLLNMGKNDVALLNVGPQVHHLSVFVRLSPLLPADLGGGVDQEEKDTLRSDALVSHLYAPRLLHRVHLYPGVWTRLEHACVQDFIDMHIFQYSANDFLANNRDLCISLGFTLHFSYLSGSCWLAALAFNVYNTFSGVRNKSLNRVRPKGDNTEKNSSPQMSRQTGGSTEGRTAPSSLQALCPVCNGCASRNALHHSSGQLHAHLGHGKLGLHA